MKLFRSIAIGCLLPAALLSCNQAGGTLYEEDRNQIREQVLSAYENHIEDLMNLDYDRIMTFYPENHIIFGDGKYWGDYDTIDRIWRAFTGEVSEMIKWDLRNHQVYAHSRDAASYLVEFENWRIDVNGDTTKVHGSFSFGMQRFADGWKAATQNVTHHYTAGPPWIKKWENLTGPFSTMPIQVGIVVSDFERSLDFYTNVLGMTEVARFSTSPDLATEVGLTDNNGFDAVVLKLNDVPGAAEYKLVKVHDIRSEPLHNSFLPGLRYITIHVKNVDQWIERLKSANVVMLTESPITLPGGNRILNFLDPDGALVEIIGP